MANNHVTILEIDNQALEHNLNYFKSKLNPETKILAVVKAFGYGSDGVLVGDFLKDKVDYFGVAYAQEGIALREAGIETPIMVLHPQIQNFDAIINHRLEPCLYNFKTLDAFFALADERLLLNYPVHLNFNTGLNRLGFWHNDIAILLSKINENKYIKIISFFSHLAASEDPEEKEFSINQINNFAYIVSQMYKALPYEPFIHMLNTSGVINYSNAQFDMVRVGIGLYGFGNDENETSQLQNTHNLYSVISQVHLIEPGETVGYNRVFVAKQPTKTATVPIGHADGIPRAVGNQKGFVIVNNQKAPIIGNVCMDMIMIDVTKIDCKEGDRVTIFNSQEMIQAFSDAAETIPYETLTAISARVKKMLKKL
ncbi:MAG: alanine racemase [Polaribacter sp.]